MARDGTTNPATGDLSGAARGATRVPVTPNDAIWLQDSATNLMIINGVFVSDHLDLATLRQVFRERVVEGAEGRYARFHQRVMTGFMTATRSR